MQIPRRRWLQGTAASLLMLTFGACGLPKGGTRTASTAVVGRHTSLAKAVQPRVAAHPGQTGLHALADAHDAIAARLALADAAQSSLDVQYFIWNKDQVGKVLLDRLLRAADRGVRVRLLLDDLGTMPSDAVLLAIDSHPNVEVRMFNPATLRTPRMLGILADFARLNKRMHNKSFTADGVVSIVGGRNIGDEYYGAHAGANFADLDVAIVGPAVKQVSSEFDLYWNHAAAVPISNLAHQKTTPEQMAAHRATLAASSQSTSGSAYAQSGRRSEFARELQQHDITFQWGRATIVHDQPDKVLTSSSKTDTHLAPQLREVVDRTKHELFLVSPYFVPGKKGVDLLVDAHRRGARVVVVTNSLASTDGIPVHSKYKHYREDLVAGGIELYETKAGPSVNGGYHGGGSFFGSRGSSGASLHAKTFAFDRNIGFIGSYNLDPRSNRLNTEMGVLFDCPVLAKRLPEETERDLARNAYHVRLENGRPVWVSREGNVEKRYASEPEADFVKRLKSQVIGWLPIEWLL